MDYREVPERDFDGITSVGMMEHVGAKNYRHYFDEMFKLLKPAGRLLNHQITISKDKPNNRPGTDEFLDRYIFPDGDLASPGSSSRRCTTPASRSSTRRTCGSITR